MARMPSPGGHSHLLPDNPTAPGWGLGPGPDRPRHTGYLLPGRCSKNANLMPFFHFKSFKGSLGLPDKT